MKRKLMYSALVGILLCCMAFRPAAVRILSYEVNPATQELKLYWKDDKGQQLNTFERLRQWQLAQGKELVFAMNGGMFTQQYAPLGLYVAQGKTVVKLNTANAEGNFYLKPNGVFGLTKGNKPFVCTTEAYPGVKEVLFATQSGPMLVTDGAIHPAFKPGSKNLNIRNGVGILPGNKVLLAMSEEPVSLYDFAVFFRDKGCRNALYLDGFVSRTYWPAQGQKPVDGVFGVMIGVTQPAIKGEK